VAMGPRATFAYVVNRGGNDVSAYSIASNGALTPVPGLTLQSAGQARSSGYHQTDAFTVASRNGKYGTLATCRSIHANRRTTIFAIWSVDL